jgi:hypothetical protein
MTEYITQEQAIELSCKRKPVNTNERWAGFNMDELHAYANAAIQHYIDSQPKTATTVREQESYRQGVADGKALTEAITQQAEALAQALAEVERLKEAASMQQNNGAELLKLRAQLASLQFDEELPEPTWICVHTEGADFDFSPVRTRAEAQELIDIVLAGNPELTLAELCTDFYTTDQLRQAIANDRAKQIKGIFAVRVAAGKWQSLNDQGYTTDYVSFSKDGRTGQMDPYGRVTSGEVDALAKQVPQDCRLCANYTTATGGCTSVVQCVDASQFRGTSPRRYWTAAPSPKEVI